MLVGVRGESHFLRARVQQQQRQEARAHKIRLVFRAPRQQRRCNKDVVAQLFVPRTKSLDDGALEQASKRADHPGLAEHAQAVGRAVALQKLEPRLNLAPVVLLGTTATARGLAPQRV